MKGYFFDEASLVDQIKGDQKCRIDSGGGVVIQLLWGQENPQFGEETEAELLIWFPELPGIGEKLFFPGDNAVLCYQERGNILLFETFQGSGWLLFPTPMKKEKLSLEIDLNLIRPHHNFSNSDFQYVGGDILLRKGNFEMEE